MSRRIIDPAMPKNRPCHLAVECAMTIAEYCTGRFPSEQPPHPMLDVPYFAEKVQRCIDDATTIGLDLKRSLEDTIDRMTKLEAENKRLREALEQIADGAPEQVAGWGESGSEKGDELEAHGYDMAHSHFGAIALAALGKGDEQ